jgi:hypothetical protein
MVVAIHTTCFNIQELCIFPAEHIYAFRFNLAVNIYYVTKH